ncbi:MAG: hypothetical protein AABZ32_08255 [Bacteroidota bacterium]
MIATARNYDVICLELRNHSSQLDNPLKKDLNKLLADIKDIITSDKKIKASLDTLLLSQLFNFRVKAIKWLFQDSEFNLTEMLDEVYPQVEELKKNPKLEVLAENILFALRCNRKVVDAVVATADLSKENLEINAPQLPTINYEQFISAIALGVPDDAMAQKIIDWTNSYLYIEFVTVAAAIINDEPQLKISDKVIKELAFIIADAAQEYSALATELGILKLRSTKQSFAHISFDNDFIKEQKKLADLGLDDYSKNLVN